MAEDFFERRALDLINTDRLNDIKTTGLCAPQRFQVRAATELLADVVDIGANIKTFAAHDAKIDFGKCDPVDRVAINVDQAWLALDHFSLARELVQRHAAMLFCGNHWRHLIEIAPELFKCGANAIFIDLRDRSLLNHLSLTILCVGRDAEHEFSDVLLIFAHEQILDLCAASHGDQEQARRCRIERAAMADSPNLELASDQRHDVVRSHALCFIDKQNAVRSGIQGRYQFPP